MYVCRCVDVWWMLSMCGVKWSAKMIKKNDSVMREIVKYKSDMRRKKLSSCWYNLTEIIIISYNMGIGNEYERLKDTNKAWKYKCCVNSVQKVNDSCEFEIII